MNWNNLSRYVALTAGFLLVGAIMYYFNNIIAYILIAWVLSMVGQPLMRFFQSRLKAGNVNAGPNTSAVLVLLIYLALTVVLIWLFVPLIVRQAAEIATVDFNMVANALEPPIRRLNEWLTAHGLSDQIKSPSEQLRETILGAFDPSRIANFFSSLISIAAGFLIDLFSVLFITFFFLKEQGLFVNFLTAIVPNRYEGQVRHAVDDASDLLSRYFRGILLQITIISIIVSSGLSIIGIPNALLIGLFAALINVIPYVGPLIGAIFGIFVTISSHLNMDFYTELFPLIMKVAGVFALMQLIDNFFLQPFIFSNSVLAHPLEIFIVILMGAKINGILGMALAIPAYSVIRLIARVFLSEFKIVQKLTGRLEVIKKPPDNP